VVSSQWAGVNGQGARDCWACPSGAITGWLPGGEYQPSSALSARIVLTQRRGGAEVAKRKKIEGKGQNQCGRTHAFRSSLRPCGP
jgi:hypothetical protein